MTGLERLAAQRKHTLFFLRFARASSPVFLDTDVDMTRISEHRRRANANGQHYSVVSYVIGAAARVLARHSYANCAIGSGLHPRVLTYTSVDAKLALDKWIGNQRVVVAGLITGAHVSSLGAIQAEVDRYKSHAVEDLPEFHGIRLLHRLPAWLGWLAFSMRVHRLSTRSRYLGTFSISSLGHRPVNGFHAIGGTAVVLNLGQVRDSAVVRQGHVTVAPLMRLNMTFDHRLIDGALAADLLTEVKVALECGSGLEVDAEEHVP